MSRRRRCGPTTRSGALTPALNEVLADLPTDAPLDEADDDVLAAVAALYAVLDQVPKQPQVGMVKLSKVLARKRPGLIPIYDEAVRECYTDCEGPRRPGRTTGRVRGTRWRCCAPPGTTWRCSFPSGRSWPRWPGPGRDQPAASHRHRRVEGRPGCLGREAASPARAPRGDRLRLIGLGRPATGGPLWSRLTSQQCFRPPRPRRSDGVTPGAWLSNTSRRPVAPSGPGLWTPLNRQSEVIRRDMHHKCTTKAGRLHKNPTLPRIF